MDERLAKLLLIAFDQRCSDGERLAAMNAIARTTDPAAIGGVLTAASDQARRAEQPFMLGPQQQVELAEALVLEKDQLLAQAKAEIDRLREGADGAIHDGIDLKAVIQLTGLSRATLYRRMAASEFPAARSSAGRAKLWSKSEVAEWIRCGTDTSVSGSEMSVSPLELGALPL